MTGKFARAFQFDVRLKDVDPSIWRRIEVPENYSFWDLHVAIQDAMGWKDYHLHAFRVRNPASAKVDTIGIPDEEFSDEMPMLAGWDIPITRYFTLEHPRADYEYDFGDGWDHEVTLEEVLPRGAAIKYPRCINGGRACPPEDCGGVPGYENLLEIIRDPKHEEHQEMLEWVGGSFDPERFDARKVRFSDPARRWKKAFGGE